MKIAFYGTGSMGAPMALNLIRAGHEVTVFNRTAAKAAALAEAGAKVAKSPADAARGAEAAVTVLADDRALRETILADGGVIGALPRGAVHLCCGTISVALSKELAGEHARHGQGYVAAPVLGRPDAAAAKKLWIITAGAPDQVERCRPLMEAMGRGISVMGEQPWQANVTKIAANFMIASLAETLGEAFALIRKAGMDPHAFLEVVNPAFNSPIYTNYSRIIADRQYDPPGFRLELGLKDVGLAVEAARDFAAPMPMASLVRDHYLDAIAHGQKDLDWAAVAEVAARNAGLEGE